MRTARVIEAEIIGKNVTEKFITYKVIVNEDNSGKFEKDKEFDIRAEDTFKMQRVRGKFETETKKAREFNIGDIVNIRGFSNFAYATPAYFAGKISKKRNKKRKE